MRIEDALANNRAWYRTVLGSHGIEGETTEHYWSTGSAVPPYYSNLLTRTREGTKEQVARLRELAAAPPHPRWGLNDCFAALDSGALRDLGLELLFEAHWYGAEAEAAASAPETEVEFEPVRSDAALEAWEAAWQLSSPAPGVRVFPPALLAEPAFTFFEARRDGALAGGGAVNLSEGVAGLSNLFALGNEAPAPLGRDFARAVQRLHPDRGLVGYGPASELAELAAVGFKDLGPLRVWLAAAGR